MTYHSTDRRQPEKFPSTTKILLKTLGIFLALVITVRTIIGRIFV